MTSTQDRFLAALAVRAEADKLTLVLDHEYANRGTLYLSASLDPVEGRTVRFEFGADGGTFKDPTAHPPLTVAWYSTNPTRQVHPTNTVSGCLDYLYNYLLRGEL